MVKNAVAHAAVVSDVNSAVDAINRGEFAVMVEPLHIKES